MQEKLENYFDHLQQHTKGENYGCMTILHFFSMETSISTKAFFDVKLHQIVESSKLLLTANH